MKRQAQFAVLAALFLAGFQTVLLGQISLPNEGKLANVIANGSSVKWDVVASHSSLVLSISAPDGRVFQKEFQAGASPEFTLTDKLALPDGTYTYELRANPNLSSAQLEAIRAARGKDDEPERERAARKHPVVPVMVQHGSFALLNGQIIVAGAIEEGGRKPTGSTNASRPLYGVNSGNTITRLRNHRALLGALPDEVINDDLIVQGSACVGLDCVNNESFGFDTIRLKENNTRISFRDTSTAAGFPTNDWTIRANSSASGGASFLAFVDRGANETGDESGTIVFEVDAGAPANSVKIASNGKVGFRTATPVLDLHMNTSDTPAVRFEQNNSGGFTAQTWDVAGNEANFFVRDVTGGSRLPFRIRPGAPTSSIDINATGNVGIGTASPSFKMSLSTDATGSDPVMFELRGATNSNRHLVLGYETTANFGYIAAGEAGVGFQPLALNPNGGSVGIGTNAPTDLLSVNGTASKPGGGSWSVFSDERLKNITGRYTTGLNAVMGLRPLRYQYRSNNALGLKPDQEYVGFGAQELQKIIPEAVTRNANGYLMVNNDPIIWTMLNAIKEQQQEILQLRQQVRRLQSTSHRRKR